VICWHPHTHDAYPDAGIGLATVKRRAERHDGMIGVASNPSEGTTILFTLPIA